MALEQHPDVVRLSSARRSRLAELVSRVTEPGLLVPALLVLVAVRATGVWPGLAWAALAALFCVGLPYVVLLVLIRRGAVIDRHVVVRDQRRVPLVAAVASVVLGVVLLERLGAPRPVLGLVVSMLAGLVTMTLVSLVHKASFHVAVVSGAAVVLAVVVGPAWGVLLAPAVGVVAWARVRAGRHTVGQAVVGLLVGSTAAALVYPAVVG